MGVRSVHGGFDRWVLQHASSPLGQLRSVVKAAEKKKSHSVFISDGIVTCANVLIYSKHVV